MTNNLTEIGRKLHEAFGLDRWAAIRLILGDDELAVHEEADEALFSTIVTLVDKYVEMGHDLDTTFAAISENLDVMGEQYRCRSCGAKFGTSLPFPECLPVCGQDLPDGGVCPEGVITKGSEPVGVWTITGHSFGPRKWYFKLESALEALKKEMERPAADAAFMVTYITLGHVKTVDQISYATGATNGE